MRYPLKKKLVLSATLENLDTFKEHVHSTALLCGLSDKQLTHIELALEEVLVNVINYAYPETRQGDIEVSCSPGNHQQGISIQIVDDGVAFDPLAKVDPDTSLTLNARAIGGLGIFLTKKMMDEVVYERRDNKNIITMTKNATD